MRRTVKATIGVTTVAGALAIGGGTALACFNAPSLTSPSGATSADDEMAPATTTQPTSDDQSSTNQMSVTDDNGTTRTVSFPENAPAPSNTGAMTEEQHESSTAQKHEAEDTNTDTNRTNTGTAGDRDGR